MNKKAFRCKNIYTAMSPELIDGYVVCEGEKILFVGPEKEATYYIDDYTEIFRFDDNFIMPGFNDFHVHLLTGALIEKDGVLRYANTEEEAAEFLWQIHKDDQEKRWIMGGAWDNFRWPGNKLPTKHSLDKYFKETPVFLLNKECHGAWANSEALKRFNIDKDTPDPDNGCFFRFENGDPTGYIHEAAIIPILKGILKEMSAEEMGEYTKIFAAKANKLGITSVGDLPLYGIRADSAYKLLDDKDQLTVRINFALDFKENIGEILNVKENYCSDKLMFIGVKDFIDGTPMGHTGFMLEEYSDMPGFVSKSMIEPAYLKSRVATMAKNNIKVRLHACGDGAVRLGIDAYEYALKKCGNKDLRHCIEHIEAISPEDIHRFGDLHIIASVQPDHLPKYDYYKHPFHTMIGEERMKYSWPFNSIKKSGGVLAFGTDYPVTELNPLRGVFRAVTRLTDQMEPDGGFCPDEKLTIHEALRAYTYGSAYAAGREKEIGSLETGKLADMAIMERNIFEYADNKDVMFNMSVLMTVVGGRIVYSK